ncbi:hypothetical protein N7493_011774 [Penicillium malachiteum]|uniref:Uncharacterized protein n=1 Tax=Penicillium malachiteum TaxID=1324776 RepID=A0AAD6MQ94_9EURO|nr:hypothetical protein N7493_011774 [Penicillium malachiteum]
MPPSLLLLVYKEDPNAFTLANFPGLPISDASFFGHCDPEIPPSLAIALATDISDNSFGEWNTFDGFKLSMFRRAGTHVWYVILKKDNGNGSRASTWNSTFDAPKTTTILGNAFAKQQAAESFREANSGWPDPTEPRCIRPASSEGPVGQPFSKLSNRDDGDNWAVNDVEENERPESSASWNSTGKWITRRDSWGWSCSPCCTESNHSATDDEWATRRDSWSRSSHRTESSHSAADNDEENNNHQGSSTWW